ncbi:hypothetical protein TELCIR_05260 [Teladorsagia circumcincta]|uniref:Uncharacterized protein n=1 Tax=Teladorsagia circumcincta TaxID=45464 RepID=A0A2G9URA9_TELCI|nr:hypothetical protein TELCIR_05260 [Teladorsagia circumcincta]
MERPRVVAKHLLEPTTAIPCKSVRIWTRGINNNQTSGRQNNNVNSCSNYSSHQNHYHANGAHNNYDYYDFANLATNIPDPTTDRSRIEIHLPHSKETVRHELPRDDVTIVTALMDIGRGEWDRYRRPLEQYHLFMENLLSLQNYMVIFTDESSYSFVHKYRKNMGEIHRTKIHLITLKDLPLSRHLDAATKIIEEEHNNDKLWRSIWDPAMKDHPEARSAEYDVLVNSKTYFLYNATLEDPFSTEFFVWIDAGYGHGNQSVFPYNNKWKPQFPRNKISVIKTVLVLVINSYPQLFSITHGDWFDAFRLFSSDQSQYGR